MERAMINAKTLMGEIASAPGKVIEANFRPRPVPSVTKQPEIAEADETDSLETSLDDTSYRIERAKIQDVCRYHFRGRPQVEIEALRQVTYRLSHCHDCSRPLGLIHYIERAGICFCFPCFEEIQQLPQLVPENSPNREGIRVFHKSVGKFTEGRLPLAKFPRPDKIKCGKCKAELGSGHGLYLDPASEPQNYRIICVDCGKQSREIEGLVFAWVDDVFIEKAPKVAQKKVADSNNDASIQQDLF
jgi:hypothetical protein